MISRPSARQCLGALAPLLFSAWLGMATAAVHAEPATSAASSSKRSTADEHKRSTDAPFAFRGIPLGITLDEFRAGFDRAGDAGRQRAGLRDRRAGGRARHEPEDEREPDGGVPLGASVGRPMAGLAGGRGRRAGAGPHPALCAGRRADRLATLRDFVRDRRGHRRRPARRAGWPLWDAAARHEEHPRRRATRFPCTSGKTR